jgi:hypothetical protein
MVNEIRELINKRGFDAETQTMVLDLLTDIERGLLECELCHSEIDYGFSTFEASPLLTHRDVIEASEVFSEQFSSTFQLWFSDKEVFGTEYIISLANYSYLGKIEFIDPEHIFFLAAMTIKKFVSSPSYKLIKEASELCILGSSFIKYHAEMSYYFESFEKNRAKLLNGSSALVEILDSNEAMIHELLESSDSDALLDAIEDIWDTLDTYIENLCEQTNDEKEKEGLLPDLWNKYGKSCFKYWAVKHYLF